MSLDPLVCTNDGSSLFFLGCSGFTAAELDEVREDGGAAYLEFVRGSTGGQFGRDGLRVKVVTEG